MKIFRAIVAVVLDAWTACAAAAARVFADGDHADDRAALDMLRSSLLVAGIDAAWTALARVWRQSTTSRVVTAVRHEWSSVPQPERLRLVGVLVASAAVVHLALLDGAGPSRVAAQWVLPLAALLVGAVLAVRGRLAP